MNCCSPVTLSIFASFALPQIGGVFYPLPRRRRISPRTRPNSRKPDCGMVGSEKIGPALTASNDHGVINGVRHPGRPMKRPRNQPVKTVKIAPANKSALNLLRRQRDVARPDGHRAPTRAPAPSFETHGACRKIFPAVTAFVRSRRLESFTEIRRESVRI